MTTWHVVPSGDQYDILRAGRAFRYGVPTPEDAVRQIRKARQYKRDDRVVVDPSLIDPRTLRGLLS